MSINATLFAQMMVFFLLVVFTMKFVWPPIAKALDDRAQKIADGLAAADKARFELSSVHKQVEEELSKSRSSSTAHLADAERLALVILEEAKQKASVESRKIVAAARIEADVQIVQARESLREHVAALAVKGAEQILRREVNASVHADLLSRLKTEL